jgi:hypothetical protein
MTSYFHKSTVKKSKAIKKLKIITGAEKLVRARNGAGEMTLFGDILSINVGIMSFYKNEPEYDMNKIINRKQMTPDGDVNEAALIGKYEVPFSIEDEKRTFIGVNVSGVVFKYPEDFVPEDQIPAEDTLAYWTKVEKDDKTGQKDPIVEKKEEVLVDDDDDGNFRVDPYSYGCLHECESEKRKVPYDDTFETFLKPLGDRQFALRRNQNGKVTNMNIVLVCMDKTKRDVIMSIKGDKWVPMKEYQAVMNGADPDYYDGVLNGVGIRDIEMSKGYPASKKKNTQFGSRQLSQIRFA